VPRIAAANNAQIAGMLGAAIGLTETDVTEHLVGEIIFFAVPPRNLSMLKSGSVASPAAKSKSCLVSRSS
jgi:hypothetical protein